MESLIQKCLVVALGLVSTWHWYDKSQRDKRFDNLETEVDNLKKELGGTKLQLKSIEGSIITIRETNKLQFSMLNAEIVRIGSGINTIEDKIDRIMLNNTGGVHGSNRHRTG